MALSSFLAMKQANKAVLERVQQEVQNLNTVYSKDDRYWQPVVGKDGSGSAVIRFLPSSEGEEVPFVRIWSYGWKNALNNKWYIEESPTTLGQAFPDPMAEYNSELWNSGEAGIAQIRKNGMQRKLAFISNIYVVNHPGRPDDEGKVFLYRYGKKIFDKLNDRMNPPEGVPVPPMNPFDLWEGASFNLRIAKGEGGFRNYDSSMFLDRGPLAADEDMAAVWAKQYLLLPEVAQEKFKPYDELRKKLDQVLGRVSTTTKEPETRGSTAAATHAAVESREHAAAESVAQTKQTAAVEAKVTPAATHAATEVDPTNEHMEFFAQLAKGKKK